MGKYLCRHCHIEKPTSEFYASDKGGCKECIKNRVKANREAKADYYKAYDAMRFQRDPWRREMNAARIKSPEYKDKIGQYRKRWIEKNSDKRAAHVILGNAINRGEILKPDKCEDCGNVSSGPRGIHGHHEDYTKPLSVVWLCPSCHFKRHRKWNT